MQRLSTCVFLLFGLIGLTACQRSAPEQAKAPASPQAPPRFPIDDTARFLAGLPGSAASPFRSFEDQPEWHTHERLMDAAWRGADAREMKAVRAFQARNLPVDDSHGGYVFYPFSGPDVLYLLSFFPGRSQYVLVGLEPVGSLPTVAQYSLKNLDSRLKFIRKSTDWYFQNSFFLTLEMSSQFHTRVIDGAFPVICLLLSRMGYTLDAAQFVRLDPKGEPVLDNSPDLATHAKRQAVEITFHRAPNGPPQRLYYFSADLGKPLAENQPMLRFLDRLGPADTFLKSAAYLPHLDDFRAIRVQVLRNSRMVVEDDTGVPYHCFAPAEWDVHVYGKYVRPSLKVFRRRYQPDLARAFTEPVKAPPLAFNFGYGHQHNVANLLIARRIGRVKPAATTVVTSAVRPAGWERNP